MSKRKDSVSVIESAMKARGKPLRQMAENARLRRGIAADHVGTLRAKAAADGFDIAKSNRTRRRYTGTGGGADKHQPAHTLWQIRETARAHERNSSLIAGVLNRACDEIVGPSFEFKPRTDDEEFDKRAAEHIRRRMDKDQFDWRGEIGYWTHLRLGFRSLWRDGDFLNVFLETGAVQTFEADELTTPRQAGDRWIVNGVEYSKDGPRIAYYVKKAAAKTDRGLVNTFAETQEVPAEAASLPAYRFRFNASRGVPFLHASLGIYDRLDGYLDSETLAAELASHIVYLLLRGANDSRDYTGQESRTSDPNATSRSDAEFDKLVRSEPGAILQGFPGEDVKRIGGDRPNNQVFEPYVTNVARIFGAGIGMPLELLMLDFSKTNFSSAKASFNVAQRAFRGWQSFMAAEDCLPWYRWQIARAIAAGELPVPASKEGPADPYAVQCIWPAWPYIDLQRQMQAFRMAIEAGIMSRSQIIRESSPMEPKDVFKEIDDESLRFGKLTPQPISVVDAEQVKDEMSQ